MPWMAAAGPAVGGGAAAGGAAAGAAAGAGTAAGLSTGAAAGSGVGAGAVGSGVLAGAGAGGTAPLASGMVGNLGMGSGVMASGTPVATSASPGLAAQIAGGAETGAQPGMMTNLLNRYLDTEGEFGFDQIQGLMGKIGEAGSGIGEAAEGGRREPATFRAGNIPENQFTADIDPYTRSLVDEYMRGGEPFYG